MFHLLSAHIQCFVCISSKAINHFASSEHHKNIKQFLWKHGPSMDCVDDFKISDADVAKVST